LMLMTYLYASNSKEKSAISSSNSAGDNPLKLRNCNSFCRIFLYSKALFGGARYDFLNDKTLIGIISTDYFFAHPYSSWERGLNEMIVEINAFKDFHDPRKFCCHAGVAPFSFSSGSSIRSSNRVSQRADKSIKSLLHIGALTAATCSKGELHEYYLKKVAGGKNKMSVLNAIRAKLVHRMFAVIRNNKVYEKIINISLHKP
ncbi:hypothetical protein EZS27_042625, partial [termite gut metagenome]